jgi:hypothetical protein
VLLKYIIAIKIDRKYLLLLNLCSCHRLGLRPTSLLTDQVINGGVWTSQGHYYSWDIRMASLLIAFLFLLMYYKKYHVLRYLITMFQIIIGFMLIRIRYKITV